MAAGTAPPAAGYFEMKPIGSFASLPTDSQAASLVRRSSWEPRPDNRVANATIPPATFKAAGYSGMKNHATVFGRVTGNFTGTTDEIIQWAAIKWGVSDNLLRAQAVTESNWYQNRKDANGLPMPNFGYGDFGSCAGQGSPPPSGYGTSGPSSFGILQVKWCAMKDASAAGYDGWPWSETSTAYNLDFYGAILRGCYEGWDTWLGNGYVAGDMWGCVGRWYSGQWYSSSAQTYITKVKEYYNARPWLNWTDYGNQDTVAPVVKIASPSDNAIIGRSVTINSSASDNVKVVRMELFIDGNLKSSSTTAAVNYTWNSRRATRGSHLIRVKAKDAAGNISAATVTVYR